MSFTAIYLVASTEEGPLFVELAGVDDLLFSM